MRSTVQKLLILGFLLLTSACQNIEVGIEPTATIPLEPTPERTVTPLPVSTSTPSTAIATPTVVQVISYSQTTYGFSLKYPATWVIQQEKNSIKLKNGPVELQIGFKKEGEEISIMLTPQPNLLSEAGSVNFLTQSISRNTQISNKNILAVFYNHGAEIKVGSMLFTFLLQDTQPDTSSGITQDIQDQADQIVASFEATFELTTSPCTDKVSFIQDVTVLDDTRFSPGEKFIKTWRLANSGTCTWTTSYALEYVDGDQMSGGSSQPFTTAIIPGQTIDLSVELTAPASNGTYRGNWMLRNDKGDRFGLGLEANKPFWVQITVGETTPDIRQTLGEPSFNDTLASTNNWFLLDTSNTKFTAGEDALNLTMINTGQNDEWGLANLPPLKDFYLEFQFRTQAQCSGLDRYGVIVRAPDPNQGYVYGFSCDGRYRLYKWDGKLYRAIQEWKSSSHIKAGPDQTNRLGIYLKGDNLKLYANGQLLSEYTDETFSEGRFGVFIGADETQNFSVFLDEVAYWKLGD